MMQTSTVAGKSSTVHAGGTTRSKPNHGAAVRDHGEARSENMGSVKTEMVSSLLESSAFSNGCCNKQVLCPIQVRRT